MSIFDKVKAMILDYLEISEDLITLESSWEEMGIDSIDLVEFIIDLEKEFDFKIEDEDLEDLKTLGDLVQYIEEEA